MLPTVSSTNRGAGLPAETLRLVTPFEKVLGFEGGDQLVDLGVLPTPLAAPRVQQLDQ
jgi:hypothetical protein